MSTKAIAIVSLVCSLLALCLGGATAATTIVDGGDVRNGSITAADLHVNSVTGGEIRKSTIRSSDIGTSQVTPSDVSLPAAVEFAVPSIEVPVTTEFSLVTVAGTYTKQAAESTLRIDWNGYVRGSNGGSCQFQLRVNGQPPAKAGGEVAASEAGINVGTAAYFNLEPGPAQVEIWAKLVQVVGPPPVCVVGPSVPGIGNAVLAQEVVS